MLTHSTELQTTDYQYHYKTLLQVAQICYSNYVIVLMWLIRNM